ncbi:flagellar hook-associated protein 1 FlgK [Lysinibacillus composti]|uniref:Flagellar hook-associated protein 1 n=1 Tax=Lysinibacillus composti TaxID=720633 RepID=A0A3N9UHA5_9BACI|nr:flagellar hook-associated protein FlgK [Lysinibacillus composti]MBM7607974.1 flagellar hook-associated protein 1 FlgK [Lysinibacillus composti]RQW75435.1 flagellar hook-associated protein FlgK [Lysinibacillus composti]
MRSTFMGLETSKRGLYTQQTALYTTGHNIANANTEGYSRQRVNLQETVSYPGVGLNNQSTKYSLGTGVEAGSVQRIRDDFVDRQYRQETSKLGYWTERAKTISQMEDVLNEPSEYGLSKALDDFTAALQDLTVNPENGGARSVVVQRGIAVADSFNYLHKSITQLKENARTEIGVVIKDANSVISQIASLNQQILASEPNGYTPNDLYDARDRLLDELSSYFPIETKNIPSGGNSATNAEGSVTVSLKLKDGNTVKLVDGKNFAQLRNTGDYTPDEDGITPKEMVTGFHIVKVDENGDDVPLNNDWTIEGTETTNKINNFSDLGKLKSLVNSYSYSTDGSGNQDTEKSLYSDMIAKLDQLAMSFAAEFNKLHIQGTDIDGNQGEQFFIPKGAIDGTEISAEGSVIAEDGTVTTADGTVIKPDGTVTKADGTTTKITAGNIYVSQDIINNPDKIAASDSAVGQAEPGNGKQSQKLANLKSQFLSSLEGSSVQTYFEGIIGQLGVDGIEANRMQYNAETLQQSVTERRASVSSVSLDEEMTNMISFQQAYNANARMISVIDEILDKIINGLGRAGL